MLCLGAWCNQNLSYVLISTLIYVRGVPTDEY